MERANLTLFLTALGLLGAAPILLAGITLARRRTESVRERGREPTAWLAPVAATAAAVLLLGGVGLAWTVTGHTAVGTDPAARMPGMGSGLGSPEGGLVGTEHPAPVRLAGQPLTAFVQGQEARATIASLHASGFPLEDPWIATYGEGRAIVWHSAAPEVATAAGQVRRMRERIADGGSPFEDPYPVPGADGVYGTAGMGQVHYFFSRGAGVWWLSVDPSLARRALDLLLRAAA